MSSAAQTLANQANAQHSTGPVTEEGKARVAENRLTHGLAGSEFRLLAWESPEQFTAFAETTKAEYNPHTREEDRLVRSIIQHYWLMQRALTLQDACAAAITALVEQTLGRAGGQPAAGC
jgi:hypothetical protein